MILNNKSLHKIKGIKVTNCCSFQGTALQLQLANLLLQILVLLLQLHHCDRSLSLIFQSGKPFVADNLRQKLQSQQLQMLFLELRNLVEGVQAGANNESWLFLRVAQSAVKRMANDTTEGIRRTLRKVICADIFLQDFYSSVLEVLTNRQIVQGFRTNCLEGIS